MSFQSVNKRQKGPDGSPISRSNDNGSTHRTSRPNGSSPPTRSSATIQHNPSNANPSIRLTVKAPPSKLRQAISGSDLLPNPYQDDVDSETPDPPPRTSRATRNPRTVVEADSDEDEDMEDEEQDEDGEDDDDDDDAEGEEDAAEDSDDDDDDDAIDDTLDMNSPHPPPPKIVATTTKSKGKQKVNIVAAAPSHSAPLKSVEDKEMDDDDDDELSDLEEEEELEGGEEPEEDEESELDDEDGVTREGTPDLTKLTRRQRAAYDDSKQEGSLMALSNEAQKKKHLTAEEISMRRAEMARRRKNLSEKRNEEEKMDTINKLLKKPAPKRKTRLEILQSAADYTASEGEDGELPKPSPFFTRYRQNKDGARLGVPEEWLEKDQPLGDALRQGWTGPKTSRNLIEEVA